MADWFTVFDEQTARVLPKPIDPKTHAALDYLTASAFFLAGGAAWGSNKRAGVAAMINGFMVLGISLFTDYTGNGQSPISFETHGKMDVVQMSMAASMPTLMGFGDSKAAAFFRGQALNEALVVSFTDWSRRTQRSRSRRAA